MYISQDIISSIANILNARQPLGGRAKTCNFATYCSSHLNNNNNNNKALSNSWTNRNCVHSDKKYIDKR